MIDMRGLQEAEELLLCSDTMPDRLGQVASEYAAAVRETVPILCEDEMRNELRTVLDVLDRVAGWITEAEEGEPR